MLVGVMSDTHDCLPMIEKAIDRLNTSNVKLVLHAGDYCAPFTATRFKRLNSRFIGVLGNCDGERDLLKKRYSEFDKEIRGRFAEVTVGKLKIALIHGEDEELLKSLIRSRGYQAVVHGHTHKSRIYRKDGTIVINPGEVCGYLSGRATIGILDTSTRKARIIDLK